MVPPKITHVAVILLVAASILLGAFWLPLGQASHWVYRLTAGEARDVVLSAEETLSQTFRTNAQSVVAVNLFSNIPTLPGRTLELRILDQTGQELGRSLYVKDIYLEDYLRLTFFLPPLTFSPNATYILEVRHAEHEPVSFVAIQNTRYVNGELAVDAALQADQDVALELITRAPLSFGARQGVLAGVIFFLGSFLIQLIPVAPRWRWILAALLLVIICPLAMAGIWFSRGELGINDWDYYFSLHHIWRQTLVEHHQFPQWNPYTCGGTAALADPEFSVVSPSFLFELLWGVPRGLRFAIWLSTAVGSLGMLQLARSLRLSLPAALLAALVSFFGSVNLLEMVEGHVNIIAVMWIPWIFWSWRKAYLKELSPVWCGIFLALTFLKGGIYLLMYTLLAFLCLPLLTGRPKQALATTFKAGLWALGLSAFKLVPVLLWLREFPDKVYASSNYTLSSLGDILFGRHLHGEAIIPAQTAGWHEYGAYIGYGAAALALLGTIRWRRERFVRVAIVAAILAILLSSAGPILKPLFDSTPWLPRSMISRVILFAVLPLGLLAGVGLDIVRQRLRHGGVIALILLGLVAVDLMSLTYQLSEQAFVVEKGQPLPPAPPPIAFTGIVPTGTDSLGHAYTRAYMATVAGYGTLNYCSVLGPQSNIRIIESEVDSSVVTTDTHTGSVKLVHWDPRHIVAEASLREPSEVVINTNYAEGWSVNGQPAEEIGNRVGKRLPPGTHHLSFVYQTPGLFVGLGITLATGAVLIGRGLVRYRRRA